MNYLNDLHLPLNYYFNLLQIKTPTTINRITFKYFQLNFIITHFNPLISLSLSIMYLNYFIISDFTPEFAFLITLYFAALNITYTHNQKFKLLILHLFSSFIHIIHCDFLNLIKN